MIFLWFFKVFEICRHFGPPFTLVSSRQDTICEVTSGTCICSACHISSSQAEIYLDRRKCLRDALQRVVATKRTQIRIYQCIKFHFSVMCVRLKRWNKWVNFVLERRKMWVPGKTSSLCCKHFAPDDFQRPLNTEVNLKRDFKKDEIGVCVFPSMHPKRKEDDELPSTKRREAQMVRKYSHTCSRHFMWFFFLWFTIGPRTIKVKEIANCFAVFHRLLDLRRLASIHCKSQKWPALFILPKHSGGKNFNCRVYLGVLV